MCIDATVKKIGCQISLRQMKRPQEYDVRCDSLFSMVGVATRAPVTTKRSFGVSALRHLLLHFHRIIHRFVGEVGGAVEDDDDRKIDLGLAG